MTETTTLSLTDFLLARIAEDEVTARSKDAQPPWIEVGHPRGRFFIGSDDQGGTYLAVDPGRVLAECEAKRRIVEWCGEREMIWVGSIVDDPTDPDKFVPGAPVHPADAVVPRLLALPYADHPDYDEEWRP